MTYQKNGLNGQDNDWLAVSGLPDRSLIEVLVGQQNGDRVLIHVDFGFWPCDSVKEDAVRKDCLGKSVSSCLTERVLGKTADHFDCLGVEDFDERRSDWLG